jgi:hypothetical protein
MACKVYFNIKYFSFLFILVSKLNILKFYSLQTKKIITENVIGLTSVNSIFEPKKKESKVVKRKT